MFIRAIVKHITFFSTLLCVVGPGGCSEPGPSRGAQLCAQIDSICPANVGVIPMGPDGKEREKERLRKVDSLVGLSEGFSGAERFAVLCKAVRLFGWYIKTENKAAYYGAQLDSLPFPEVTDKETAFLVLKDYAGAKYNKKIGKREIEWLSGLFFALEHRWHLTPEEQCLALCRKSEIYCTVFVEYESANAIARKALDLIWTFDADEKLVRRIFLNFWMSYVQLEEGDLMRVDIDKLLDYARQHRFTPEFKSELRANIGSLYVRQKNYKQAYAWHDIQAKVEKPYYIPWMVDLYIELDSLPQAFAYIESKRKQDHLKASSAWMSWDEAKAHLKAGDRVLYERCLVESVRLAGRYQQLYFSSHAGICDAYIRMLWTQGRRDEAIRHIEGATRALIRARGGQVPINFNIKYLRTKIERLRSYTELYQQAGLTAQALEQTRLCDSMERVVFGMQLEFEKRKTAGQLYVADLTRNLEQKAIEVERGRNRTYVIGSLLLLALLAAVLFAILYRKREKQLNILYAKQKEIESLQRGRQMEPEVQAALPADEQLFRQLDEQLHAGRLYLNPGLSLDDLCRAGASNRMYVSSSINKFAGMNFNQWVNKARIDHALGMIRGGEDDLRKLAEGSGFSSEKSFFRSFRQFTSLSPRQYIIRERRRTQ